MNERVYQVMLEALKRIVLAKTEDFDHSMDMWEELKECVETAEAALAAAKEAGNG